MGATGERGLSESPAEQYDSKPVRSYVRVMVGAWRTSDRAIFPESESFFTGPSLRFVSHTVDQGDVWINFRMRLTNSVESCELANMMNQRTWMRPRGVSLLSALFGSHKPTLLHKSIGHRF